MSNRRHLLFPLALAAACLAWTSLAAAAETREQQYILGDNTNRIFIQGIRPLGMGGAFIAVADDENALFYNPAGLARLNYWRFTFPYWLMGTDIRSFDNILFWISHAGEFSKFPDGISEDTGRAIANSRMHLLGEGSLRYIGPNFGFGVYLLGDALAQTDAALVPEVSWDVKMGLIENMSFGWGWDIPMFGYVAGGVALKATQRGYSRQTKNAFELADFQDVDLTQEWGGGMDLGLLYQPIQEVTVALVVADLYTRILEEVQVPNLKIGAAFKPSWLNYEDLSTTLAFDVVELNWQGDNEFKNNPNNAAQINLSKVRFGVEFLLSRLVALRGGISQGYPSAGIGLKTSFLSLEWAYFGRELGTYPGQNPEWNQRISIDWHTGALVATPTPLPTATPTVTPTLEATMTPTPTPTMRPTPQPTLTGKIPKLQGTFVGFLGTITVVPKLPEDLGELSAWKMVIADPKGRTMKKYAGRGQPPKAFVWDGKDPRGRRVSSKQDYPFTLSVTSAAGETRKVEGKAFIVDTIPKLYTAKNYEIYPDRVYFSIKDPNPDVTNWKLDIFNDANQVVRSYVSQEELFKAFYWDAKDESGNVVPNNVSYRYELSTTDKDGNQVLIADRIRPVLAQIYESENRTTIKIGGILFDIGKAYLTSEMFDKVIKSAYVIHDEPASEVVCDGHTDSTGPLKLNMRLSLVRAESVRRFLVEEQNVPNYQITIQGWGPTKPIATNKTVAGRKQNRRVEVIIRMPR